MLVSLSDGWVFVFFAKGIQVFLMGNVSLLDFLLPTEGASPRVVTSSVIEWRCLKHRQPRN